MSDVNTIQLADWVVKIRAGDSSAHDALVRATCARMERLARKMLSRYPGVRRWVETGDVLQSAMMRLFRAIEVIEVRSVREFFGLAAEQMRRELIDLSRKYRGSRSETAHRESGADLGHIPGDTDTAPDSAELVKWSAFHSAVETLSTEDREIVSLIYYHGWTQSAVAGLLQMSVRTVQRRWEAALLSLRDRMKAADE